jgi:hypothetical protein
MKVLTFQLVGGTAATFFVGNSNLVVSANKDKATCTLVDGLHNNGGWQINASYAEVVLKLREAFNA